MSDRTTAHIGENSPEQVAYKLLVLVGKSETKINGSHDPINGADRKWLLDTYAECLRAVKGNRR